MNAFDLLFWTLGAYVILGILKNDAPKGWLLFGLIAGLGLQNKLSMGFFGLGLCVALVLTPNRKYIAVEGRRQVPPRTTPVGGRGVGPVDLPPPSHLADPQRLADDRVHAQFHRCFMASPLEFLALPGGGMNAFNLPIWLAGLYFYLFSQRGKRYRMMGIIYVSVFILLILQGHARAYYLHVAYPMLFAGGAVLIESFVERGKWRGRILKPVIVTALVASTALMLPGFLPVMPPKQLLAYQESRGDPAGTEVPRFWPTGCVGRSSWPKSRASTKHCLKRIGRMRHLCRVLPLGRGHRLPRQEIRSPPRKE